MRLRGARSEWRMLRETIRQPGQANNEHTYDPYNGHANCQLSRPLQKCMLHWTLIVAGSGGAGLEQLPRFKISATRHNNEQLSPNVRDCLGSLSCRARIRPGSCSSVSRHTAQLARLGQQHVCVNKWHPHTRKIYAQTSFACRSRVSGLS